MSTTELLKPLKTNLTVLLSFIILFSCITIIHAEDPATHTSDSITDQANNSYTEGNYNDAFKLYHESLLKNSHFNTIAMFNAIESLQHLNRYEEIDPFIKAVIAHHNTNWKCYKAAGIIYDRVITHTGFIQAGKFYRGRTRNYKTRINTQSHDHLQALNYLQTAANLIINSPATDNEKSDLYYTTAMIYIKDIYPETAIKLLILSDLKDIPAYTENVVSTELRGRGAPVNKDGKAHFFNLPSDYHSAKNDGERFRWLLHESSKYATTNILETEALAMFSKRIYGVETISNSFDHDFDIKSNLDKIHQLSNNQSIAKLETGVQLLTLPTPYNYLDQYITLFKTNYKIEHAQIIATEFEDRLQYNKAAKYWQIIIDSPRSTPSAIKNATQHLAQITDGFIKFESSKVQSTHVHPELWLQFRNTKRVNIKATKIKTDELLTDTINILKNHPAKLSFGINRINDIGRELANDNRAKYLGKEVYNTNIELAKTTSKIPHGEDRTKITLPKNFTNGAYFIEATLPSGYKTNIILWLNKLTLTSKPLTTGQELYFAADSNTGVCIPNTELYVFGYNNNTKYTTPDNKADYAEATLHTDKHGLTTLPKSIIKQDYHYLVRAKAQGGLTSYIDFKYLFQHQSNYEEKKNRIFYVTDKPLYRAGEKVQLSGWIRDYDYTHTSAKSADERKEFTITLYNPKGEKSITKNVPIGINGNFNCTFQTKSSDTLGIWRINSNLEIVEGGNYFRLEEYKRPEFTVNINTDKTSQTIFDDLSYTITTEYLFGKPLQNAKVNYTLYKQPKISTFHPIAKWDWLYGKGYLSKYSSPNIISTLPSRHQAPMLISESTIYTDKDGKAYISISPTINDDFSKDVPYEYKLTVTVSDSNNNTITRTHTNTLTATSFQLSADSDQNYYNINETATITFAAHSNGKPTPTRVSNTAIISIFKSNTDGTKNLIASYNNISSTTDNTFIISYTPKEAGKYIVHCETSDQSNNLITQQHTFFSYSKNSTAILPTTSAIQVIPKHKTYSPAETAEVLILTQQPNTSILLFKGMKSKLYPNPDVINTKGNANIIEYEIKETDIPNTYIEALTISEEAVHTATAELITPPIAKILNIDIIPEETTYTPASTAKITLQVSDADHNAFSGQGIITVYDAALDEIAETSNTPQIDKFFWGFMNHHYEYTNSSFDDKFSYNLYNEDTVAMQPIGLFGHYLNQAESAIPMPKLGRNGSGIMNKGMMLSVNMVSDSAMFESDALPAPKSSGESPTNSTRKDFSTTAVFINNLNFDNTNSMTIDVPLPDTLTKWKIKFWAITSQTEVAEASTSIITSKELMLIPAIPRFLIENDSADISTTVYNNSDRAKEVTLFLNTKGGILNTSQPSKKLLLKPNSQQNTSWKIVAKQPEDSELTISVSSNMSSDAITLPLHIIPQGQHLYNSKTILLTADESNHKSSILLPENIKPESAKLAVKLYPNLQSILIDSFNTIRPSSINSNDVMITKIIPRLLIHNMIEKNKSYDISANNIYNKRTIIKDITNAVTILDKLQNEDGGWSWIGQSNISSPYITAITLRSLERASQLGMYIPAKIVTNARLYLIAQQNYKLLQIANYQPDSKQVEPYATALDALIYSVLSEGNNENEEMREFLFTNKSSLTAYGLTQLGLGLFNNNQQEYLQRVLKNIAQYLVVDEDNETAYLHLQNRYFWWYWYGSEAETTANYLALRLLTNQDTKITDALTHNIINSIKNTSRYDSIGEIASTFYALDKYINQTQQSNSTPAIDISLNQQNRTLLQTNKTTLDNPTIELLFNYQDLTENHNTLTVSRASDDSSPIYYSHTLSYFSLDEIAKPNGLELKIERKYFRLTPINSSYSIPTGKGSEQIINKINYNKEEIKVGSIIHTGDLIETELLVTSKNDYEYIFIQDNKAASLEPTDAISAYRYTGLAYYIEYRDKSIDYYIESMPRGTYSFTYKAYSLFSGTFIAPAATSIGAFAPTLNSNSAGFKFNIAP